MPVMIVMVMGVVIGHSAPSYSFTSTHTHSLPLLPGSNRDSPYTFTHTHTPSFPLTVLSLTRTAPLLTLTFFEAFLRHI